MGSAGAHPSSKYSAVKNRAAVGRPQARGEVALDQSRGAIAHVRKNHGEAQPRPGNSTGASTAVSMANNTLQNSTLNSQGFPKTSATRPAVRSHSQYGSQYGPPVMTVRNKSLGAGPGRGGRAVGPSDQATGGEVYASSK